MGQDARALASAVVSGDRRALAKAITLVESSRPDDRLAAGELMNAALPHAGGAMRIAISGTPGAGKSTFIEALGCQLVDEGHRLAVLAIDPSSSLTGGSILGDKTRMPELTAKVNAFIRPSPAGATLGGIASSTREAMLLTEAAGVDIVLVETVGVGQSEAAAAAITDLFVLLVNPGSGDELQGIKRGVLELADLVLVNKADGDLLAAAHRSATDHRSALTLMRPKWPEVEPEVLTISALKRSGLDETWRILTSTHKTLSDHDLLAPLRSNQATNALWSAADEHVRRRLQLAEYSVDVVELEREVSAGERSVSAAVEQLVRALDRAAHDN